MQVKLRRVSEKPGWSREPKKLKNSPTNKRDGVFMPNSVAELKSNRKCTRFRRIRQRWHTPLARPILLGGERDYQM